jgi:hypothetical protein
MFKKCGVEIKRKKEYELEVRGMIKKEDGGINIIYGIK